MSDLFIGARVRVIPHCDRYGGSLADHCGVITRESNNSWGVMIDGMVNRGSQYGTYWFYNGELIHLKDSTEPHHTEDSQMEERLHGFDKVAMVKLINTNNNTLSKEAYAYALYEDQALFIKSDVPKPGTEITLESHPIVVVSAMGVKNTVRIGFVVAVLDYEEYLEMYPDVVITAEVIHRVDMYDYEMRQRTRQQEAKRRRKLAAIRRRINDELVDMTDAQYIKRIKNDFGDINPKIKELAEEMEKLIAE